MVENLGRVAQPTTSTVSGPFQFDLQTPVGPFSDRPERDPKSFRGHHSKQSYFSRRRSLPSDTRQTLLLCRWDWVVRCPSDVLRVQGHLREPCSLLVKMLKVFVQKCLYCARINLLSLSHRTETEYYLLSVGEEGWGPWCGISRR